jgi:hypothetical protein
MLDQMTAMQTSEMMLYFEVMNEEKECLESEAREANLMQFFASKVAQQKKDNG